jgi:hypothetical protein
MGARARGIDAPHMPRLALALAFLFLFPAVASASGDAGYWAFADRMQARADRYWNDATGLYDGLSAGAHSNVLLTYSIAAMRDHHGTARNDRRARRLVDALTSSPPFVAKDPPRWGDSQTHSPGWVASMTSTHANQHLVVDSEVIDGLRYAWLARRELGLSRRQADRIADRIHRTALGSYWRWPTIRLNQVGWYALVYAANATVTGSPRLLRHDLRLQLARFVAGARGHGRAAGNLGPGLHFHYLPHMRMSHPMNVDSAEYANITASFAREYAQARRAGMRPLPASSRRLLRSWLRRVMAGYWTHAGYLNWDTGFGFRRWHQTKKLGLSQQALLGIATAPQLAPFPAAPAWAKWMIDRGFEFYERQLGAASDAPPGVFFGVRAHPEPVESARLALTRMESNAARAIAAGLGSARAVEPPPLYSFDPDTGRLAVTTPAYNTAVVPSSRGAFPYGGIELARFYDSLQRPVGGIGGRPAAAFGLLVRDISGRRVFAGQLHDRGRLWLTRAPHGVSASASAWTGRAFAGAFQDLRARGISRGGGWVERVSHRFTASWVETSWRARRSSPDSARATVDVLFPTGSRDASIVAEMRDGRSVRVGTVRMALRDVARFRVGGYFVVPRSRPRGATVHVLHPRPQSSAPTPGPTLAIQLARAGRTRSVAFRARVLP